MRIIIAGGSGFIGSLLAKSLLADGHHVSILTRRPKIARVVEGARTVAWDGQTTAGWGDVASEMDVVVNLAGESLGAGSWSATRKDRIVSSRVEAGKAITTAIFQADPRPKVLIQASAVGFYGLHGDEPVTEDSAIGNGFLSDICRKWEESTQPVERLGVRRVVIRTGVVLSKTEGALPRMLLPFKLFVGGPVGSGKQGFPWIHPDDEISAIRFLIYHENALGAYNLSAPAPLSNLSFGKVLAKELRRPFWLRVPAFAVRLLLGEMSTLILDGQYMYPVRLRKLGFRFRFETAEAALHDLFNA